MYTLVLAFCILYGAHHDTVECGLAVSEPPAVVCDTTVADKLRVIADKNFTSADGRKPILFLEHSCERTAEGAVNAAHKLTDSVQGKMKDHIEKNPTGPRKGI